MSPKVLFILDIKESLEEMSIHRKLMTGCAVAVLTFGLAACGGGSDNTADERDSLQDQINALQTAYGADPLTPAGITELQAALGTAQTALEAATAGLAAATAEVMGLQAEVMGLMATLGDETDPDADSVRGMLAAKIAELSTAMDVLTAAQDQVTQLTADLAAANARIVALVAGTDPKNSSPRSRR